MAADLNFLPRHLKESLMPFQVDGIRFGIKKNGRCLLGDEMGLGKTLQAIAIMYYFKSDWPLLIVVPSSVKFAWAEELEKWIPELQPGDIKLVKTGIDLGTLDQAKVSIITYGLFSIYCKQKKSIDIAQFVANAKFGAAILDESHALKNSRSARSKTVLSALRKIKHIILLSGTPSLARPEELYSQIQLVRPGSFGSFREFADRFCDGHFAVAHVGRGRVIRKFETRGASNLDELHEFLNQNIMIRRLKSKVLSQLPPKRRQKVLFEIPETSKHKLDLNLYRENIKRLKKLMDTQLTTSSDENLVSLHDINNVFMRLNTSTGLAKASAVQQYISDLISGMPNKFIVFCYHLSMVEAIVELLVREHVKHITITGAVDPQSRSSLVHQFQEQEDCRVAVLSVTAAATGITLTAADHVVFAELHWTPGVMLQAEDRCHRIGQKNAVQVHYLVAKGTIDESLWGMLLRKISITSITLDGSVKDLEIDKETVGTAAMAACGDWVPAKDVDIDSHSFLFHSQPAVPSPDQRDITSYLNPTRSPAVGQTTVERPEQPVALAPSSTSPNCRPPPSPSVGDKKFTGLKLKVKKRSGQRLTGVAAKKVTRSSPAVETTTPIELKESTVVVRDTAESPDTPSLSMNSSEPDTWSCTTCTFMNHPALGYCEMCGDLRPVLGDGQTEPSVSAPPSMVNGNGDNEDTISPHSTSESQQQSRSPVSSDAGISDVDSSDEDDDDLPAFTLASASKSADRAISAAEYADEDEGDDIINDDEEDDQFDEIDSDMISSSGATTSNDAPCDLDIEFSDDDGFDFDEIDRLETGAKLAQRKLKQEKIELFYCLSPYTDRVFLYDEERQPLDLNVSLAELNCQDDLPEEVRTVECWMQICSFVKEWESLGALQQSMVRKSLLIFKSPQKVRLELKKDKENQATSKKRYQDLESLNEKAKAKAQAVNGKIRYINRDVRPSHVEDAGKEDRVIPQVIDGRGRQLCVFCFKIIRWRVPGNPEAIQKYCSSQCQEEFAMRSHRGIVRDELRRVEKGECQLCHFNAVTCFERIKALAKRDRKRELLSTPYCRLSVACLNKMITEPREGLFWEADHVKAVVEGGGECGLDNYRTLCTPCHREVTGQLRQRLAAARHTEMPAPIADQLT